MPSVYLAGPIAGTSYDGATEWRNLAFERLRDAGIEAFSPMRFKHYLAACDTMPHTHKHPLSTAKGIVTRDLWDVRRCDVILAHLAESETVSIGTVWELGAAASLGKPVVATLNGLYDHPMIEQTAGYIVETLHDAIRIVIALLKTGV